MPDVIHKYPLAIDGHAGVPMPRRRRILCVQVQAGVPCVWAVVDPDSPMVPVAFAVVGTGHAVPEDAGPYLGTVHLYGGSLVLHVFGGE